MISLRVMIIPFLCLHFFEDVQTLLLLYELASRPCPCAWKLFYFPKGLGAPVSEPSPCLLYLLAPTDIVYLPTSVALPSSALETFQAFFPPLSNSSLETSWGWPCRTNLGMWPHQSSSSPSLS